jgi:patatin-like phospholipase/acyl hydrolase
MKKLISIDGGGIRGIISAYILMKIEEELQDHLVNYVDLVVGTSTGAIVGGAITNGMPMQDVVDFYLTDGPKIFNKKNFKHNIRSIWGLKGGRYDVNILISHLEARYGKVKMKDLKTNFLCTSYNMTVGKPLFLTNKDNPDLLLSHVVAASSAAPTYFDPVRLDGQECVDGGLFASNPGMVGYAEIKDMFRHLTGDEIFTLSIGNGNRLEGNKNVENWFKLKWIEPLIDIMMAADGSVVHYELTKIYQSINASKNYYRLTDILPPQIERDMACATSKNLNELYKFADSIVVKNKVKIKEIAEKLKS